MLKQIPKVRQQVCKDYKQRNPLGKCYIGFSFFLLHRILLHGNTHVPLFVKLLSIE